MAGWNINTFGILGNSSIIGSGKWDDENVAIPDAYNNAEIMTKSLNIPQTQQTNNGGIYAVNSQPGYNIAQTEANVTTPTPGSWSWDTSMWNPSNWFRGKSSYPTYSSPAELAKAMNIDINALDATGRMNLERLFQNQQNYGLAQQALGWGKIGAGAQLIGAITQPFFAYKNYQLAKDNLNFMKEQANKNWLATARNYNDRATMLNWGSSSFDGGANRNRYREIPER